VLLTLDYKVCCREYSLMERVSLMMRLVEDLLPERWMKKIEEVSVSLCYLMWESEKVGMKVKDH
jgi:hypothetical protein